MAEEIEMFKLPKMVWNYITHLSKFTATIVVIVSGWVVLDLPVLATQAFVKKELRENTVTKKDFDELKSDVGKTQDDVELIQRDVGVTRQKIEGINEKIDIIIRLNRENRE